MGGAAYMHAQRFFLHSPHDNMGIDETDMCIGSDTCLDVGAN